MTRYRPRPTFTDADFWARIQKTDACWLWTGCRNPEGYGKAGSRYAHRWSWTIHNGAVPDGLCVLHRCDNPPCCNPAHLFLGTKKDNLADMDVKGRRKNGLPGSKNHNAKLTEAQVGEIRRRHASGASASALGNMYGVSDRAIEHAVARRSWRHVP